MLALGGLPASAQAAPGRQVVEQLSNDAIADYLREDNANVGAPYATSRSTDALVATADLRMTLATKS